jgi:hypothetical protein
MKCQRKSPRLAPEARKNEALTASLYLVGCDMGDIINAAAEIQEAINGLVLLVVQSGTP